MEKYVINKDRSDSRLVEAESFATVGDFIDFFARRQGVPAVILRVRSSAVRTVELISSE
ncbi:hypothetical protein [Streptomyces sp. NPDC088923]|uniref:hypothetical protein n=1 Tax=Streptomyces sp. NPDC088923 TaxID=3365913 RepID=UPI003803D9B6